MNIKRETKHIRGIARVLNALADEVEHRGNFNSDALELLCKIGSDLLFKGVTVDYRK